MNMDYNTTNIAQFNDSNVSSLKLKINEVEFEINTLENERAEIEKLIHEFEIRHNQELGEIILEILKLRKENLEEEVKVNTENQNEYTEAKKDYEDFQSSFEYIRNEKRFDLTKEEQEILKSKYRQASKLCHPDIVNDNMKDEAEQIFKELNEAYGKNDLSKVKEILNNLEKGIFISKSDTICNFENLQILLNKLLLKRENIYRTIQNIKKTDTYQTIDNLSDWDTYFYETKKQLISELSKLQTNE